MCVHRLNMGHCASPCTWLMGAVLICKGSACGAMSLKTNMCKIKDLSSSRRLPGSLRVTRRLIKHRLMYFGACVCMCRKNSNVLGSARDVASTKGPGPIEECRGGASENGVGHSVLYTNGDMCVMKTEVDNGEFPTSTQRAEADRDGARCPVSM